MRDLVHQPRRAMHGPRREEQVRQRVQRMGVASMLGHEHVRPVPVGQGWDEPIEGKDPIIVRGRRLEGDVHLRPSRPTAPQLVDEARSGEEIASRFV